MPSPRPVAADARWRDAVVGVVDGDTMMPPGCVENAVKLFGHLPSVGGITTNEFCQVEGGKLVREWHSLRLSSAINMCSMALVAAGADHDRRLSFFRACA